MDHITTPQSIGATISPQAEPGQKSHAPQCSIDSDSSNPAGTSLKSPEVSKPILPDSRSHTFTIQEQDRLNTPDINNSDILNSNRGKGSVNLKQTRPKEREEHQNTKQTLAIDKQEHQDQNDEPRKGVSVIGKQTPLADMIKALTESGCQDLTQTLALSTFSDYPLYHDGFSDVYHGLLDGGRQVAVKTLRISADSIHNPKHLKRAARELHAWSNCQHPNVLPLLGLAVFRGRIGMVSPWMESGNLQRYLDSTDNLQFTETTQRPSWSIRWAAPELLHESVQQTEAADVCALGMTILEVITGKLPYEGKSDFMVVAFVSQRKLPERPEEHIPIESSDGNNLWELLKRCWEYDPDNRPDAAEVTMVMRSVRWQNLQLHSRL